MPVNPRDNLIGFTVHMLWEMHHQLSLIHPKLGELIAFRNIGVTIPECQSTDEDYIRMSIERNGFSVVYAPEAVVMNRGPGTLSDLWKQRVRVNIGESYLKARYGYTVPTWEMQYLFPSVINLLKMNKNNVHMAAGASEVADVLGILFFYSMALGVAEIAVDAYLETRARREEPPQTKRPFFGEVPERLKRRG